MGFDAEYSYVPASITSKQQFYAHILENLKALLHQEGNDARMNWVSALASVSSVLYNSYADYSDFGNKNRVNWAGFYLVQSLFPSASSSDISDPNELLIGPYHGKPGCLRIPLKNKRKGVCADAFLSRQTVIVQDVHQVPGHIACDGTTESEIVIPLIVKSENGEQIAVGVLDIDCQKAGVWNKDDRQGLESIVGCLMGEESVVDWSLIKASR